MAVHFEEDVARRGDLASKPLPRRGATPPKIGVDLADAHDAGGACGSPSPPAIAPGRSRASRSRSWCARTRYRSSGPTWPLAAPAWARASAGARSPTPPPRPGAPLSGTSRHVGITGYSLGGGVGSLG